MLPDTISAALFVAGLTWLGYSFREWNSFAETADKWIRAHDEDRSARQIDLLTSILSFTLPDLTRTYLALEPAERDPVINRDHLRNTVVSIDAEPVVHDVRIREDVTKPVLIDPTTRMISRLPRLLGEVVVQPDVLEGVQDLGCLAIDLTAFRRRKARLAWRYQLQAGLLVAWLLGVVISYLPWTPWWTIDAAVSVGILPVLHGAELELRRHRLKSELTPSSDGPR